jgi:hypothetical protein
MGMAVSEAPLTTTVMNSVDVSFSGATSRINNAASQVAALLAVAVFGLIMVSIFNRTLHGNVERGVVSRYDRSSGKAAEQARRDRIARGHRCR